MSFVITVTDDTFDQTVLACERPVLVDYWADWCGPCKQLGPVIDELAEQHSDKITFAKLDAGTNPQTAAQQKVMGLPTVQIYVAGQLVQSFRGAKSKAVLLKALQPYL